MNKTSFRHYAFCAILVIVFMMTGCKKEPAQNDLNNPTASGGTSYEQNTTAEAVPEKNAGTIQENYDIENAKNTALQNAGLSEAYVTFIKAETDYEDKRLVYDIEFVTGTDRYKYEINAADGTILEYSTEKIEQIPDTAQEQALITADEAKAAALNYAGLTEDKVTYVKVELDYDDGQAEYEIEFFAGKTEYDFTINAVTGAVLEMETEYR